MARSRGLVLEPVVLSSGRVACEAGREVHLQVLDDERLYLTEESGEVICCVTPTWAEENLIYEEE